MTTSPAAMTLPDVLRRAAVLEAEAEGEGLRVALASETPVTWWWGVEVLGHGAGEVNLDAFGPNGIPLLRDHRNSVDAVIGRVTDPEIRGGRLYAQVRFAPHPEAQALRERVLAGTLGEVSVGYSVEAMEMIEGRKGSEPPVYRATRWTPRECSLVAVPADHTAGIGRGRGEAATREVAIRQKGSPMGDDVKAPAVDQGDDKSAAVKATARKAEAAEEARRRELAETMAADRERTAEIEKLGTKFNVPRAVIEKAQRNGTTLAEFQGVIIDHLGDGAETALNRASAIGMSDREVERFSLARLIHGLASRDVSRLAPFEHEVTEEAANRAARDKRTIRGALVPNDVLGSRSFMTPDMALRAMAMRALVVGDKSAGTGGQTVDTVLASGSFIDLLRNRSILMQAGARVLSGLVGDVAIPKQTGAATMYWVGENGAPTESTPTLGQVALTPHTAAAYTQFSRKLMLQSSIDVEAFIRDDLSNVLRIGIDYCALNGDADADAPDGIADLAGINVVDFTTSAQPTWAEVIKCWTEVAIDNADIGTLAYLMGPAMAGYLMSTPKVSSADSVMMMTSRAELAGYRALISTQVAAGELWFGNWADLIFGFWSGLDIMADPYSAATSGATRVVAFQDVDYGARNVVSFCKGKLIP